MIYEKKKNRTRIVELKDGQCYELMSGEKLPIKSTPMIFSDLYAEWAVGQEEIGRIMTDLAEGKLELDEKTQKALDTNYNLSIEIITASVNFMGYEIDEEWIKSNMSFEDVLFYIYSLNLKRPVYCIEDFIETKKK